MARFCPSPSETNDSLLWPTPEEQDAYIRNPETRVNWMCATPSLAGLSTHFLALGATGSGKTNLLKMLLHSVLKSDTYTVRYRALVNDPKLEYVPFLHRIGIHEDAVIITNPFDSRSSAWDTARDLETEADVGHFANSICPLPEEGESAGNGFQFWATVANASLRAVVNAFRERAPGDWELRDVIEACATPNQLQASLQVTEMGRRTWEAFYGAGDTRLASNSFATLWAQLSKYQTTAALWHHARTRFSVRAWRKRGGIILLGTNFRAPHEIRPTNNLIAQAAFQSVLAEPGSDTTDYSWFFLDELSTLGDFPYLMHILKLGRSKGARVVLADQTYAALRSTFSTEAAIDIINQCGNKAILALASAEEQEFAAQLIGQSRQLRFSHTVQDKDQSTSHTQDDHREYRVPPEAFAALRRADDYNGAIHGWFQITGRTSEREMSSSDVDRAMPPRLRSCPPPLVERDAQQYKMVPWTDDDRKRFGFICDESEQPFRW